MFITIPKLAIFLDPYTYNLKHNKHALFGFLWGIPIPIFTIAISIYHYLDDFSIIAFMSNLLSFEYVRHILREEPFQYFFFLHPLFFLIIYGAMGTINRDVNRKLHFQIHYDYLTKLRNRRQLFRFFEEESQTKNDSNISIILWDIDRFKQVNDLYGHFVGDCVLQRFADILITTCRQGDVSYRLGGEEFVTVLLDTSREEAYLVAERIREVWAATIHNLDEHQFSSTVSGGVAFYDDTDIDACLHRADMLLYAAKKGGRNQIKIDE